MYTSIFDILLFQCQKMGNFQFFIDFLPVFSEGRGPKNVLKKKILEKYSKNISYHKKSCFRYQNYVLAILQVVLAYMRESFYKYFFNVFRKSQNMPLTQTWEYSPVQGSYQKYFRYEPFGSIGSLQNQNADAYIFSPLTPLIAWANIKVEKQKLLYFR